jgi:hypothetical protein
MAKLNSQLMNKRNSTAVGSSARRVSIVESREINRADRRESVLSSVKNTKTFEIGMITDEE